MYPLLKSGDTCCTSSCADINDIFLGDIPAVDRHDGEEYVTVKYIQKSDRAGYVKLVSQASGEIFAHPRHRAREGEHQG